MRQEIERILTDLVDTVSDPTQAQDIAIHDAANDIVALMPVIPVQAAFVAAGRHWPDPIPSAQTDGF